MCVHIQVARLLRKLAGLRSESGPASIETAGAEDSTDVIDTAALQSADFSSLYGEDFRVDDDSLEIGSASTMDHCLSGRKACFICCMLVLHR